MERDLAGLRKMRVGHYRIIYEIEPEKRTVLILAVGPRKTVYETFR